MDNDTLAELTPIQTSRPVDLNVPEADLFDARFSLGTDTSLAPRRAPPSAVTIRVTIAEDEHRRLMEQRPVLWLAGHSITSTYELPQPAPPAV